MNKKLNICIFILSIIALIISLILFSNIGVFVDEYNTNPDIVYGGELYNYFAWARLLILFTLSLISFYQAFIKRR